VLKGADIRLVDRVLRVDGHAELPRKGAEPEGVVAASDRAIVVEVETRGDPRVRRRGEPVGVRDRPRAVLGDRQIVVVEPIERYVLRVEIELVDEQHVGCGALDDLGHALDLRVGRSRHRREERAIGAAVQRRIERRETQRGRMIVNGLRRKAVRPGALDADERDDEDGGQEDIR
jgi:hypothetical protein